MFLGQKQSIADLFLADERGNHLDAQRVATIEDAVDLAIVIPVYNGRNSIEELCDRLIKAASVITDDFRIVLVDDRSADDVWPLIVMLGQRDNRVRGIQLSRNFGQHFALTAGIDHVRARWYAVMDCDLQDAPEDLSSLFAKALEGYDIVVGIHDKDGHSRFKRAGSRLFYGTFNLISRIDLRWDAGNYRIFSNRVADAFRSMREGERFLPAAFGWMGFEVGEVKLQHNTRKHGTSAYSFRKLVSLASSIALYHSEMPLRAVASFGFVMSVLAMTTAAVYVLKALITGTPVVGWTSLIVAISVIGSIQIFMIGVVGIYVGKTFRETKKRPLYLVREYSGFESRNSDSLGVSRRRKSG